MKLVGVLAVAAALSLAVVYSMQRTTGEGSAQAPASPAGAPAAPSRVPELLAAMTLEEKIRMLHGARDPEDRSGAGYIPGVPRLGVPPLRLADGPAGIRTREPATALPAPVALAATFDVDLARRYGAVMGRELRWRGQHVLLAPMVNIVRVPYAGRNFETLGEDPLLASQLVAAQVRGIQDDARGIATVKHYAANNQEDQRTTIDVRVDDRALREIELAAFEAAVKAGAGAVMAAYNQVNGEYATESRTLLTDILRGEWGFTGFVMSDWGATHSAAALPAGMDMEMPAGTHFGKLAAAVERGELPLTVVDTAVGRILTQMERVGLVGGAAPPAPSVDEAAHARLAREVAVAGAVLLRNEGNVLPLSAADLGALALIGPTARVPLVGGGGSARVEPLAAEGVLEVLEARGARVTYEPGLDVDGVTIPASTLGTSEPIERVGDRALAPGAKQEWSGAITPTESGDFEFKLQADGGRATLAIDGETLIGPRGNEPPASFGPRLDGVYGWVFRPSVLDTADGLQNVTVTRRLEAGRRYTIRVTATPPGTARQQVRLAWVTPSQRQARFDAAVAAARAARVAVVFAYNEGTEGRDRPTLQVAADQNALVAAVAAANPRTVVVLNTGDPVAMPWLDRVPAVLETWYPGQEGAEATVAILTGDEAPGGRLPVTFPRRREDTPVAQPLRYPGVDGRQEYSEGIFVGYRWYDQEMIAPLFPFGHGLSYTTFVYGNLAVRPRGDGFEVTFDVRNTGSRPGREVPQVYVGPPANPAVPMPPRALAGFAALTLKPGERRTVTIPVDARAISYWSERDRAWIRVANRPLLVGSSSRDIRLRGTL